MLRFLQPLIHKDYSRAYAAATTCGQSVSNVLQTIDKQHERLLRVVERRIAERKMISLQASFSVHVSLFSIIALCS